MMKAWDTVVLDGVEAVIAFKIADSRGRRETGAIHISFRSN